MIVFAKYCTEQCSIALLQDGRVGNSELSVIVRLRETVSSKLASFEASNRSLRLLLRERQRHDLNAARLVEQRDMLLKVRASNCLLSCTIRELRYVAVTGLISNDVTEALRVRFADRAPPTRDLREGEGDGGVASSDRDH